MPLFVRFFAFFILCYSCLGAKKLEVDVAARSAILINADTGVILYEKEAKRQSYPASTTKIATALYALSLSQDLDQKLVAKSEALKTIAPTAKRESNYRAPSYLLETDGTHIALKRGEIMPLRDLLTGLLVASANDAANVIAEHFGKKIPLFVEGLNAFLTQIGCEGTHFTNPHGLHHPNHFTTAHDLALIAKEGLKIPFFAKTVASKRSVLPKTNLEYERMLRQSNRFVREGAHHYPQAIGVKTGYTSKAGGTLVAAAKEGGRTLIAVVLAYKGENKRYDDAKKLFEVAFSQDLYRRELYPKGATPFFKGVKGGRGKLKTTLKEGLFYDFYPAEETAVKVTLSWDIPELPILENTKVGSLRIIDSLGNEIKTTDLLAQRTLKPSIWYRMSHLESSRGKKILLFGVGAALLLLFLSRGKNNKRRKKSRPLF